MAVTEINVHALHHDEAVPTGYHLWQVANNQGISPAQEISIIFADVDGELVPWVIDGKRRVAALKKLIAEATEMDDYNEMVMCHILEVDEAQARVIGLQMNALRSAGIAGQYAHIKALVSAGWGPEAIRNATGMDKAEVERFISLTALPEVLRDGILAGQISQTVAGKLVYAMQTGNTTLMQKAEAAFRRDGKLTIATMKDLQTANNNRSMARLDAVFAPPPPSQPSVTQERLSILRQRLSDAAVVAEGTQWSAEVQALLEKIQNAAD